MLVHAKVQIYVLPESLLPPEEFVLVVNSNRSLVSVDDSLLSCMRSLSVSL